MKKAFFVLFFALFISVSFYGGAAMAGDMMEGATDCAVGAAEVSNNCLGKLSRGVCNVALGWAEFPKLAAEGSPGDGVDRAATRTSVGIVEVGTFILPPYDDTKVEPEYFSP